MKSQMEIDGVLEEHDFPRPFVKWAGGKRQLLDELVARVPERFGTYFEPFVGGGALFFRLFALGRISRAWIADSNVELINGYRQIAKSPDRTVRALRLIAEKTDEKSYYALRAKSPGTLSPAERAARLIYLNRLGFNGLYRENSKGGFNVPYGRYKNPKVLDRDNLFAVSRSLRGVEIARKDFSFVGELARPGDFVYFDPPYNPTSKTAHFTAYGKGGFGEADQRRLAQLFGELASRKVHVLLSNSDTSLVHELYEGKGYDFRLVRGVRAINSKADRRGAVSEVLVSAP